MEEDVMLKNQLFLVSKERTRSTRGPFSTAFFLQQNHRFTMAHEFFNPDPNVAVLQRKVTKLKHV